MSVSDKDRHGDSTGMLRVGMVVWSLTFNATDCFLPAAQRLGQVEGFVGSSSWEDDFQGKIRCTSSWEDDFLFFSFGQYFK